MAVAAVALAGCGSGGGEPAKVVQARVGITSSDFKPGGRLSRDDTCDGAGRKPSLTIVRVPAGTKSLLLIMHDPDAPAGDFTHWTVYDISPHAKAPIGATGLNQLGKVGYLPACPPKGDKPHRYVFDLYALRGRTSLPGGARPDEVRAAAERLALGRGQLVATYGR